jgi:hypothetical protein
MQPLTNGNLASHITRVGFEDQFGGGDFNYNDLVFSLSNTLVAPVPEPAQWLLLALGLGVVLQAKNQRLFKASWDFQQRV